MGAIQSACLTNSDSDTCRWIIANSLRLIRSHNVWLGIRSPPKLDSELSLIPVGAIQPACLANSDSDTCRWIIANSLRLICSHNVRSGIKSPPKLDSELSLIPVGAIQSACLTNSDSDTCRWIIANSRYNCQLIGCSPRSIR